MAREKGGGVLPGLYWRGRKAYFEKKHPQLVGGRVRRSLQTEDQRIAASRISALQVLMERGDWGAVNRWATGRLDITAIVAAVREGNYQSLRSLSPEAPMLQEEVERFLAEVGARRSIRTHEQYRANCNQLLAHFGDVPMDQIREEQVKEFLFGPKNGKAWSKTTQAHYQTMAGTLWQRVIEREALDAVDHDALPGLTRNPWRSRLVGRVERDAGRTVFLLPEEWTALREGIEGTPHAAWMGVAYLAGLRLMEAATLRTDVDVDLQAGLLRVQGTKTPKARRDVPICKELDTLLRGHIQLGFAGEKHFFRPVLHDRPISKKTAQRWTQEAYEAAGLEVGRHSNDTVTHHTGRHSFATWLARQNVSPLILAELLGDTVETVTKVYCHLHPNDLRNAVSLLDS